MMNRDTLISIIIPVYNAGKFIVETLDSTLSQNELDLELIAINDGSTDSSLDILTSYAEKNHRLKVFSQENKGVSAARNLGIKKATGSYIAFLDADDFFNDGILKKAWEKAVASGADVVLCRYNWIFEDGYKRILPISSKPIPKDLPPVFSYHDIPGSIFQLVSNTLSSKLYRTNILRDSGFSEDIINGEDLLFNAKVITKNPAFTILEEELFSYNRFHGENTVSDFSLWNPDAIKYIFAFKEIIEQSGLFAYLIESYYKKVMSEIRFCISRYSKLEDYYKFAEMLRNGGFEKLKITEDGIDMYASKSQGKLFSAIMNATPPPFSISGRLYEQIEKLEAKNEKLLEKNTRLKSSNALLKKKIERMERSFFYRANRKLKKIFHLHP